MQISKFEAGGFVIHRKMLPGRVGRFSAWYDSSGNLLDAEQITPHYPRGRKPHRDAVKELSRLGGYVLQDLDNSLGEA